MMLWGIFKTKVIGLSFLEKLVGYLLFLALKWTEYFRAKENM